MMMNTERVTCIKTDEHASLKMYGVYRTLPDEVAAKHKLLRVIDESGEDYLYPESYFSPMNSHVDTFHVDTFVDISDVHVSAKPEREFGLSA